MTILRLWFNSPRLQHSSHREWKCFDSERVQSWLYHVMPHYFRPVGCLERLWSKPVKIHCFVLERERDLSFGIHVGTCFPQDIKHVPSAIALSMRRL